MDVGALVRVADGRDAGFTGDVLTIRRRRGSIPVAIVSDWSGRVIEVRVTRLERARREGSVTAPAVELTERGES